jgi:hypothetical protein
MDPDANLKEQLQLASRFVAAWDAEQPVPSEDAYRLAELVQALDGWLKRGGALPKGWNG